MKNNLIKLPIKKYRNKIPGYCLVGAYLTVRNTYEKGFNPSGEEIILYERFKNKITTLELIKLLKKHQYSIKIFSEKNYRSFLKNSANTSDLVKNYVEFIEESNIFEKTGITPNRELFINCLQEGYLLLVNGVQGKSPHMRIIFGYIDEKFLIIDSSDKEHLEVSFNSLKKLLNAPLGFWMVAAKPSK